MTADIFDRQDRARRQTVRLLIMFLVAAVAFIGAMNLLFACAAYACQRVEKSLGPSENELRMLRSLDREIEEARAHNPSEDASKLLKKSQSHVRTRMASSAVPSLWHPTLFLWVTLGMIVFITAGSLYKLAELSAGGQLIALALGGREVGPQTPCLAERMLLDVAEEMAIASGIPVPPVYVLDQEPGINALTAGRCPGDAVMIVSSGCLTYLDREEIQGVMGHEFSHVLNGDMRLNMRLVGIVYGILVVAILGSFLSREPTDRRAGAGIFPVVLVGVPLAIIGYIGVFFVNLIKAAINRQREYLADASAVQFTRYPDGLAGALKKIGGLAEGSRIDDFHAAEISHMFFADTAARGFFGLFATHPSLIRRIRALSPEFDGRFPVVRPLAADSAAIVRQDGQRRVSGVYQARQIVAAIPPQLLDAAREAFPAQAVIYALLLSGDDEATQDQQLRMLHEQITLPLWQILEKSAVAAQVLPDAARLPLVDLSIPALKRLSAPQYTRFRGIVAALVHADGKVDLFEYTLRVILFSYLDVHFGLRRPPTVRYPTSRALAQPMSVVLSVLAHAGQNVPQEVERAFQAGAKHVSARISLVPRQQCSLHAFDAALGKLAHGSAKVKQEILAAATACIIADGEVTIKESELTRALAAVLACPTPAVACT